MFTLDILQLFPAWKQFHKGLNLDQAQKYQETFHKILIWNNLNTFISRFKGYIKIKSWIILLVLPHTHFTCWSWNTHSGQSNAFYFFPTVIPRQYIGIWKDSNGINKSDNQPSCGRLTLSLQTHTILPKIFSRCLYTYCVLWMWVSGIQFLIHQVLHDVRTAVKVLIALAFMRRLSLRFRNVFIEMIYHSSRTAFVWPDSNVGQDCLACRIN